MSSKFSARIEVEKGGENKYDALVAYSFNNINHTIYLGPYYSTSDAQEAGENFIIKLLKEMSSK